MKAEFWHNLWETDNIGFHLNDTNPLLLKFFSQLNLKTKSRIFVPLCGKTVDIKWLLNSGYKVAGIELNEKAIKELFTSLSLTPKIEKIGDLTLYSAKDITIFHGDIFELTYEILGRVDAIYDRAALVALPEEMRVRYSSLLPAITKSAPQLLISFEYKQSQHQGPPFSVTESQIREYYKEFYNIKLLNTCEFDTAGFAKIHVYENVWLLERT